ncbi:Beta-lactamase domain-containing protein [Desulfonema limicola]|uniref:Beta-lactamase domain-containing protein n=1 Tax=Desulfonema limicola TaxID=45656 RepID=A0A975B9X3_9BACT|nr:serine hydrolase [Desulfonema limicola]QTA81661.1 Beta-lactamase domain-containing protein [Desulfonema limicola]
MINKKIFIYTAILLIFIVVSVFAKGSCPPLGQCKDPFLQKGLESCLASLNLLNAVKEQQLCVALVDITDPLSPRMASVNGNKMMYAASLPKIAILLGAFERISQGKIKLDDENREILIRMIRYSSNEAATEMLNRVGKSYLANLLQSPKYRFYAPEYNGGLWVGKEYGKSPAFKRDPLYNLSHGATALQVARFYYLLENGLLVSPELSREMKKILGNPAIHHKFVKGLESIGPKSYIYRKSGTWKQYHADSAIVERDGRRYIAVALAQNPDGGRWLSNLIVGLDDLIFLEKPRFSRIFH